MDVNVCGRSVSTPVSDIVVNTKMTDEYCRYVEDFDTTFVVVPGGSVRCTATDIATINAFFGKWGYIDKSLGPVTRPLVAGEHARNRVRIQRAHPVLLMLRNVFACF